MIRIIYILLFCLMTTFSYGARIDIGDLKDSGGKTGADAFNAVDTMTTEIYNILDGTTPTLGPLNIGGAGDSWLEMDNNTSLVDDYTGVYGVRFYNGVLQQIINGTASSIGSGGSGYVTPPTYSDETCTTGQYSWDASYFYGCESTDAWDRYPVTWAAWSNPTPTTPTLSTFTTATTGILSTLVFSAPVTATDFTGFSTVLPNHVLTYTGGDTTNTLTFSHDTIYSTATDNPTGSFTSPGATGISAVTGGALLADFTGATVDNQSTQTISESIAFVAVSTATGSLSTIGTLPLGTLDDNIMLASIVSDDGNNTITPPSGWIEIETITQSTSVVQSVFYKIASSESGTYEFTTSFSAPTVLHIATFSKASGTWIAPTGTNLSNTSANSTDTNITGSVTIPTGAILYCSWGNDGVRTVSTEPSPIMVEILEEQTSDLSMATYYQSGLSGVSTETLVWSSADENISVAVVLGVN